MNIFLSYLRARLGILAISAAFFAVFALLSRLGGMAEENVLYAGLLCALVLLCAGAPDYLRFRRHHALLRELAARRPADCTGLPEPDTLPEADYQALARALEAEKARAVSDSDQHLRDREAYYTLWAHQIKTPISAMRLLLQQSGAPEVPELSQELFRVEQYVDMALQYLRLESDQSDYVIGRYSLDGIVRQAVRRYAPQFIRKKLSLDYEPCTALVLTDEKWLLFVVEQVLSNALKYTNTGKITIREAPGPALVIADTGIGIEPEDLPRVFDNGFTGYNGRADKKATGIGLYLCRRVCRKLNHTISAASAVGEGTTVTLGLGTAERVME